MTDLDQLLRPARWVQYPGLATLAARRLGESWDPTDRERARCVGSASG